MQTASHFGRKYHTVKGGTLYVDYNGTDTIYSILNSWGSHNCLGFNGSKLLLSLFLPKSKLAKWYMTM